MPRLAFAEHFWQVRLQLENLRVEKQGQIYTPRQGPLSGDAEAERAVQILDVYGVFAQRVWLSAKMSRNSPGARNSPGERKSPGASRGFVGMEVTKRPPFIVLSVEDLMDTDYILQGQLGYGNELVKPGDKLLRVESVAVHATTVKHLHELLGGTMHSLVVLAFARAHNGAEYVIKVRRHGLHEHDRAPQASVDAHSGKEDTSAASADAVSQLQERVSVLEQEQADIEITLGQNALETHTAKQECNAMRKQLELAQSTPPTDAMMPDASCIALEAYILADLEEKGKKMGETLQRSRVLWRANNLRMSDMAAAEDQLRMDLAKSFNEGEALKLKCANLELELEVSL